MIASFILVFLLLVMFVYIIEPPITRKIDRWLGQMRVWFNENGDDTTSSSNQNSSFSEMDLPPAQPDWIPIQDYYEQIVPESDPLVYFVRSCQTSFPSSLYAHSNSCAVDQNGCIWCL